MLEIGHDLPPGALIGGAAGIFAEAAGPAGCQWFHGDAGDFATEEGVITEWRPRLGPAPARPTQPNSGNARLEEAAGHAGLGLQTAIHCGLSLPGALRTAARFTMAVIYQPAPEGEARTLLTVNTGHEGGKDNEANYLFLSDGGDAFTIKDTRGAVEISAAVTAPADRPRLAVVTLTGGTLAFQEGRGPVHRMTGADPGMDRQGELFIAARSHRKGLQKTLGAGTVLDVMLWPDHTLLVPRNADDHAQLQALHRYFLWEY